MPNPKSDLETVVAEIQALARKYGNQHGTEVEDFIAERRLEAAKESAKSDRSCPRINSEQPLAQSPRATR